MSVATYLSIDVIQWLLSDHIVVLTSHTTRETTHCRVLIPPPPDAAINTGLPFPSTAWPASAEIYVRLASVEPFASVFQFVLD